MLSSTTKKKLVHDSWTRLHQFRAFQRHCAKNKTAQTRRTLDGFANVGLTYFFGHWMVSPMKRGKANCPTQPALNTSLRTSRHSKSMYNIHTSKLVA